MGQHDEIEKLLKEKGLTETQGPPPELDIPAPRRILNAFDKKDYAKLEELLNDGIDPNIIISNGTSALDRAAWNGDAKAMAILIKHGAKIEHDGLSALHSAVNPLHNDKDYLDCIKLLLEKGADINFIYNGRTPLDTAMECSKRNVIKYLKQNGARSATPEERNKYIATLDPSRARIAAMRTNPLIGLIARGDIERVKEYLDDGGDVTSPGALNMALTWNRNDIAKLLIEKGADVNAEFGTSLSRTPLASLAESQSPDKDKILQMLLDAGADPKWKDKFGRDILMMFCSPTRGPRSDREERMMADEQGHAYMKAHMRCIVILKERLGVDTVGILTPDGIKQVDIPTTYGLRMEDIPVKNNTASTTMTTPTTPTVISVP